MAAVDSALISKDVAALRELVLTLFSERDERYAQRFVAMEKAFLDQMHQMREETHTSLASAEKAIVKAEAATEKRFEGVNEFRSQLSDQAGTFMPRIEAEQRAAQNAEKIGELEKRVVESLSVVNSRLDRSQGTTEGVDIVAKLGAIQRQIDTNTGAIVDTQRGSATVAGRSIGLNDAWKYLLGALTLVPILVGLVVYTIAQTGP